MHAVRTVLVGLAVATVALAGSTAGTPAMAGGRSHDRVQAALDRAVSAAEAPGIVAQIADGRDRWFGSAGVSDTATGRRRSPGERFRIGSTTKAFTAAVVLQLVAERRLGLDDTVQRWLPGLLHGNGYDGSKVTVRMLLNHTSGIFAYTNDTAFFANGVGAAWFQHRYDRYTPAQLVRVALRNPPYAAPGTQFVYSNTDSILAAMIVERVTGRRFTDELSRRIIRPLGLTGTSLPGDDPTIRGPHPVHYSTLFVTGPEPAGLRRHRHEPVDRLGGRRHGVDGRGSRPGLRRLLGGRLLPPAQQREMVTTVSTDGVTWIPDTRYGLGVFSQKLSCGVTVWGRAARRAARSRT